MRKSRSAFTLVELLVVIVIIGLLVALMLPSVSDRTPGRRALCMSNLKELAMAMATYETMHGELPGYVNDVGDDKNRIRASWVVPTLPYLDQYQLWEGWQQGKPTFAPREVFICPSDPPVDQSAPDLSYVANTGYIGDADGEENAHNGLFLDMTRTADGAPGPNDERDKAKLPLQRMSIVYLQAKGDGMARTLMLSENVNALHWGYTLDKDRDETKDRSYHFGFCWEQPSEISKAEANETAKRYRRINNHFGEDESKKSFVQMTPDDGFPSSHHPEIVNVAFASGSVQALNQDIDPLVYAQLMTSNHKLSDLQDADGAPEKELKQPEEGDW
jgi:prepilin-type N-terminal cleavage/methylation domain-containing protein